jgi:hypothetical protein
MWSKRGKVILQPTRRIRIDGCLHKERLNIKAEGSTRLPYTGLRGGLEHVQIETSLTCERFESVMVSVRSRSHRFSINIQV